MTAFEHSFMNFLTADSAVSCARFSALPTDEPCTAVQGFFSLRARLRRGILSVYQWIRVCVSYSCFCAPMSPRIRYSCTRTDTTSVTNRSTAAAFSIRCKVVIITESVFRIQHWIKDINVYELQPKSPHSRPWGILRSFTVLEHLTPYWTVLLSSP